MNPLAGSPSVAPAKAPAKPNVVAPAAPQVQVDSGQSVAKAPIDGFDRAVAQHCDVQQLLATMKSSGVLSSVREKGAAGIEQLMQAMLKTVRLTGFAGTQVKPGAPETRFVGDIEGLEKNSLQTLIDSGQILVKETAAGYDVSFRDPDTRVQFMGDAGDRGEHAMRMRAILGALKIKYPDRVDIIWGNRDLAKLGIHNDLKRLETLRSPVRAYRAFLAEKAGCGPGDTALLDKANTAENQSAFAARQKPKWTQEEAGIYRDQLQKLRSVESGYEEWLQKSRGVDLDKPAEVVAANTLANRVQYWLEAHSARYQLGNHHAELNTLANYKTELEGKGGTAVTLDAAAQHYVDSLLPGGENFEFLKLAVLGNAPQGGWGAVVPGGEHFSVGFHGGSSETATKRFAHGSNKEPEAYEPWARSFVEDGARAWAELERCLKDTGGVPLWFLHLADSEYDAATGINYAADLGTVYGQRAQLDGNVVGWSPRAVAFGQRSSLFAEHRGHTPIGPLQFPVRSLDRGGPISVMHDVSFTKDGSQGTVLQVGDLILMAGRLGDAETGEFVMWAISPSADSPLGCTTNDGYTVRGVFVDSGDYSLFKFGEGYEQLSDRCTPEELVAREPHAISREVNEQQVMMVEDWNKSLPAWVHRIDAAQMSQRLEGRRTVGFFGASRLAQLACTEEEVKALLLSAARKLDNTQVSVLSGGTDVVRTDDAGRRSSAPELHAHAIFSGSAFETAPYLPEGDAPEGALPRFERIGLIPEGATVEQLARLDSFLIAGEWQQYGKPLDVARGFVEATQGAMVFFGGGQMMENSVKDAVYNKTAPVFLLVSTDVEAKAAQPEPKLGGVTEEVAVELLRSGKPIPPHVHFFRAGDDLGAMLTTVGGLPARKAEGA